MKKLLQSENYTLTSLILWAVKRHIMICFIPRKDWSIPFTKPFMHICTSFNSFIQNFYSSPRLTNTSCTVKDVDTPYIPRINIHSLMFQRNISLLLLLLHILRSFRVRKKTIILHPHISSFISLSFLYKDFLLYFQWLSSSSMYNAYTWLFDLPLKIK